MDVFTCRVRPGGNLHHDVTLHGVTAAELELLRHVHGGKETVFAIVRTGHTKVDNRAEWVRLSETYNIEKVKEVFGPVTQVRLPETLDEDDYEDAVLGAPTPAAKSKGRKPKAHVEPVSDEDDVFA